MHNISVLWSLQGNQTAHRWNVDIDLIWYFSSVTKPFLLSWILRTIKERMTQVLTAKLVGRGNRRFFSPRVFLLIAVSLAETQQPFPFTPWCVLSSCCRPAPSESWPWPSQQRESNWTEREVRLQLVITCWLKAQMAQTSARCSCSSNPRSLFLTGRQTNTETWETHSELRNYCAWIWCRNLAACEPPDMWRVKALISCFHRQGLGVTAQWLGKVKKWAGCNDLKW